MAGPGRKNLSQSDSKAYAGRHGPSCIPLPDATWGGYVEAGGGGGLCGLVFLPELETSMMPQKEQESGGSSLDCHFLVV